MRQLFCRRENSFKELPPASPTREKMTLYNNLLFSLFVSESKKDLEDHNRTLKETLLFFVDLGCDLADDCRNGIFCCLFLVQHEESFIYIRYLHKKAVGFVWFQNSFSSPKMCFVSETFFLLLKNTLLFIKSYFGPHELVLVPKSNLL
jgi:hypothetical protein